MKTIIMGLYALVVECSCKTKTKIFLDIIRKEWKWQNWLVMRRRLMSLKKMMKILSMMLWGNWMIVRRKKLIGNQEFGLELQDVEDDYLNELDGFTPAGVGYGNITEETIEKGKRKRVSKAERKRMARDALKEKEEVTVCARCHSLRNYGQVKNQVAENLTPDFDFDQLISKRLMKPTGNADATVLVMVVDCVDFDGSFPKRAARSLFKAFEGGKDGFNVRKKLPKLVLVATKVDLLPSQISPTRLDRWVRYRAKVNGAPKLSGVYLVSSRKDLGVRNLLAFVKDLAGPRGNVWVIGAQNAGKSTLINAFSKKEGVKITKLTEAAVPGTTLGILRIGGILSAKAKMQVKQYMLEA